MAVGAKPHRYKLFGLLGVVLLVLAVYGVYAAYTEQFTPVVQAEVVADRSGLLLDRKADVTLHGITIGEARTIDAVDGHAVIGIAIDRQYAGAVPSNVAAQIVAPTVFGAKFIDLVPPAAPSAQSIQDGTVITAKTVATETNSVFDSLMDLLTTVRPAKLDATLGAVAGALRGRGTELGNFIGDMDDYLDAFNPTLPAVNKDLSLLPGVTNTYADVAPDILRIADNATTLSRTVQQKEPGLNALLLSVTRASDDGTALLNDTGQQLVSLLDTMRPTTGMLAYYSPEFPCTFATLNTMRTASALAVGGQYNGIHGLITLMPGQPGYQKGIDDPKTVTSGGPRCYPALVAHAPHYAFDDGTTTPDFSRTQTNVVTDPLELARELLGPGVVPFVDTKDAKGGGR